MKKEMTIEQKLHDSLCWEHTGKMKDLVSCSTSVLENENCQKRREQARKAKEVNPEKDFICLHCFADAQLSYQTTTGKKYARNTELYTSQVYAPELWPLLNASIARIEAFGDTQPGKKGEIQVENYFNFCKNNPDTTFAAWTKNPLTYHNVIERIGKPENLILIYSDPVINGTMENPEKYLETLKVVFPEIDKIFVVYDKKFVKKNNVEINCGARSCNRCRRCYRKNTEAVIKEQLK